MEFGNLNGEFEGVNFALPPDPEATTKTLQDKRNGANLEIRIGGAKWADKRWKGVVYPNTLKEDEYLKVYSENFNTIEFGPTFYNIYKAEELSKWKEQVSGSPDFKFLPKFPQHITHIRRFVNAEEVTTKFYESLNGLGSHVGPLLLQLPDNITPKSYLQLKAYLESMPRNLKVAVEVRHRDWFAIESNRIDLFNLLSRLDIPWVITDAPGRRDVLHMNLSTTDAIIRFVGASPINVKVEGDTSLGRSKPHEVDYTRIDEWVERLKVWRDQGLKSVWFFVHQHNERLTPVMCDYLIQQLNAKLGVDVKRPTLL
ncbi:DUF72 domain-containing protein [Mucilaginibacter flavidus]|uniref:DUF72 domain-containing protein n=1 Tax=Mucilaginibacter flavidus TaxID=2949309 RepID=UPI0020935DCC|nr:DUF72 domain-containing protein [Mucilaginibacter flavidus]MCO5948075.1 DUF72 domain-containing protein [Mucilaginibacter flavidus]